MGYAQGNTRNTVIKIGINSLNHIPGFVLSNKHQSSSSSCSLPIASPMGLQLYWFFSCHHIPKDSKQTPFSFPLCSQQAHNVLSVILLWRQLEREMCGWLLLGESRSIAPFSVMQLFTLDITGKYYFCNFF